jgi:hypothetical protein
VLLQHIKKLSTPSTFGCHPSRGELITNDCFKVFPDQLAADQLSTFQLTRKKIIESKKD